MHTFYQQRERNPAVRAPETADEMLIADSRAGLMPSEMVERKLLDLLRGASVSGTHVRMAGPRVRGCASV